MIFKALYLECRAHAIRGFDFVSNYDRALSLIRYIYSLFLQSSLHFDLSLLDQHQLTVAMVSHLFPAHQTPTK